MSGRPFTVPPLLRSACAVLVLPEGRKHCDGCNERDERRGITHGVDLPEHGEVACLKKGKENGDE